LRSLLGRLVYYGLQPLMLIGSYGLWVYWDHDGVALLAALFVSYWLLMLCERFFPAHPDWRQSAGEHASVLGISVFCLVLAGVFAGLHSSIFGEALIQIRHRGGIDVWPNEWPVLAQVLLIYFSSELVFYWIHRGLHRWKILWRASGHGFHHAFRNMHSVNFMTSHPFDLVFLALPQVLVTAALGAEPTAAIGANLLIVINGFFAHSNVRTNSKLIGWFFTTSEYHELHHSNVLEQSNTNYSCNAILWDRVFGTFCDERVEQTGIGPIEPSFSEKLLLPVRDPEYTTIAP
jgi:sterol desaturase/sphingolipid hydroxylase (fatty acid hydroxylase superfamily)